LHDDFHSWLKRHPLKKHRQNAAAKRGTPGAARCFRRRAACKVRKAAKLVKPDSPASFASN
jgi:hypothetical protein